MKVLPHPEANKILHGRFLDAWNRIPGADRGRIAAAVRVSVVTQAEFVEIVGDNRHIAYFLALADGSYRVLLQTALASWPASVSQYVMMHECAHAICGPDEDAADELLITWGFGPELRAARLWGKMVSKTPGFSFEPTAAMAAA